MKILVFLFFVLLVCCGVGISRNDINLELTNLLKLCFEEFSISSRRIDRPLVVEMAYTASQSGQTRSGYKLSFLGVIGATCCRLNAVLRGAKVAAFHNSRNRLQIFKKWFSRALARCFSCSICLFAKFDFEDYGMSISVINI